MEEFLLESLCSTGPLTTDGVLRDEELCLFALELISASFALYVTHLSTARVAHQSSVYLLYHNMTDEYSYCQGPLKFVNFFQAPRYMLYFTCFAWKHGRSLYGWRRWPRVDSAQQRSSMYISFLLKCLFMPLYLSQVRVSPHILWYSMLLCIFECKIENPPSLCILAHSRGLASQTPDVMTADRSQFAIAFRMPTFYLQHCTWSIQLASLLAW